MGTKTNGSNADTDRNIKKHESETGTGTGTGTGNSNSVTTGTGSGTGTGSTGSGSGTGSTRTGTKRIKTKKDSKVSVLEDLPEVKIPEPQEPKKKRTYNKKAKEDKPTSFDSAQISAFMIAVSSMVASREGMSHWLITEAEAKQIADPLAKILAKSESLKGLGEHADSFALISACLMVFAPRIITTLQLNKTKKKKVITNGKHNDKQTSGSNNEVSSKNTVTPSNDGKAIFESISPIQ